MFIVYGLWFVVVQRTINLKQQTTNNYAKAVPKSQTFSKIISTANPADEVNSIAYASIRTTFDGRDE